MIRIRPDVPKTGPETIEFERLSGHPIAISYIKLIPGEKNPIESWGGYGNDPTEAVESNDPEINVYTHEDVVESDHEAWGIVGIKGSGRSLLVYDLDIYKADDFDPDEITIDGTEGVPVVKSPSGGLHVYTAVYEERTSGSESDFSVADELPFDIDIRGSFVSMHPVAPNAIPGVGGDYELTNDVPLMTHSGVRDSVAKLKFAESGEPIIEYDVDTGVSDFTFERSGEAPNEMPKCYHSALQLREADPDDHPSIFKVDSLAAMCGVAAGYSKEEMMKHFLEDFSPGAKADRQKTSDHLDHIFGKMEDGDLAPPAVSTLRKWGILEDSETCNCSIDYHGGSGGRRLTDGGTGEDGEERELTETGLEAPTGGVLDAVNGGYGQWIEQTDEKDETHRTWNEWTNFKLGLNSLVTTPDGDKEMSLTIYPRNEDPYDVSVDPTVLNEPRSFKKKVCTGATTTFEGNGSHLAKIKQYVGGQEAPRKVGTKHMGYHAKDDGPVWVTPNGNLGADGWIDETELSYIAKDITAERKWYLTPEDGADPDLDKVVEMLELLPQVRETSRMLPLLGWFYTSAVRPLIMEWEGQFNFVSVTGETGAGKSTTIEMLWELFGMEGEPLTPKTTEASLLTTFASSQSVPMWYDEYKPSDLSEQQINRFHEKLRMATRGQVDQRSNVDLSDETYRLQAPTVVSGEERIQGSAEERRGIYTSFKYATRNPGTETAIANAKLNGTSTADPDDFTTSLYFDGYDFTDHALAYIMWVCDQDPDDLEVMWREADEWVRDVLGGTSATELDNLELQGLQTIKFGCDIFRQFYNDCGGEDDVISDEQVENAVTFTVEGAGGADSRVTHLEVMLDVASRAARAGYLEEDGHYTFVRKGKDTEELRINLNTAFDEVKRYVKDHGVTSDLLNNKSDYDERLRNEEDNLAWLSCRCQQSPPVGSAIGLKTSIGEAEIDGFGRWMWDSEVEGSGEDEWKPLRTSAEGRVNVTFEVTHRDTDTPDSIAEKGVISDKTKSVDYVVFDSEKDNVPAFEEGKCYAAKGMKIGTYDNAPQIKFDASVREIVEVEKGFEYIESADAGPNDTIDSAAAAADGGEIDQLSGKVYEAVVNNEPIARGVLTGLVAGQSPEYDIDDVGEAIDTLVSRGQIDDFGDGLETF